MKFYTYSHNKRKKAKTMNTETTVTLYRIKTPRDTFEVSEDETLFSSVKVARDVVREYRMPAYDITCEAHQIDIDKKEVVYIGEHPEYGDIYHYKKPTIYNIFKKISVPKVLKNNDLQDA